MGYLLSVVLGYLLGSSNMAYYIAKWKNMDMRSHGSGNLGASNAAIVLGWALPLPWVSMISAKHC